VNLDEWTSASQRDVSELTVAGAQLALDPGNALPRFYGSGTGHCTDDRLLVQRVGQARGRGWDGGLGRLHKRYSTAAVSAKRADQACRVSQIQTAGEA